MNRKLLIIQLITVLLSATLAIFLNFLTNDKNINDWLVAKGIGTKTIIGVVASVTLLLLVIEFFKFGNQISNEQTSNNVITQSQRSGDNSQNYQAGGDININQKR